MFSLLKLMQKNITVKLSCIIEYDFVYIDHQQVSLCRIIHVQVQSKCLIPGLGSCS